MIVLTETTDWAATLRALLAMGRVSQAELARATGYSEQQISTWTRGVKNPGRVAVLRIAAALGYDLALIPREDA